MLFCVRRSHPDPPRDVNHLCMDTPTLYILPSLSHLVICLIRSLWWYQSVSVQITLILLIMIPKYKSNDVSNADVPKRSHKVLPLSGKVEIPRFKRKENLYAQVANIQWVYPTCGLPVLHAFCFLAVLGIERMNFTLSYIPSSLLFLFFCFFLVFLILRQCLTKLVRLFLNFQFSSLSFPECWNYSCAPPFQAVCSFVF